MRFKIKTTRYSIVLTSIFLVIFGLSISCNKYENKKQNSETLPLRKWKIIKLNNRHQNIVFDATRNYLLDSSIKNNIALFAEDNHLSGKLIFTNKNSFTLENSTITDVCCNSEAAKLLFTFFDDTIHYKQEEDKLILSSNKTVVTLEKSMK
jgi:heat shock protein HslJ